MIQQPKPIWFVSSIITHNLSFFISLNKKNQFHPSHDCLNSLSPLVCCLFWEVPMLLGQPKETETGRGKKDYKAWLQSALFSLLTQHSAVYPPVSALSLCFSFRLIGRTTKDKLLLHILGPRVDQVILQRRFPFSLRMVPFFCIYDI